MLIYIDMLIKKIASTNKMMRETSMNAYFNDLVLIIGIILVEVLKALKMLLNKSKWVTPSVLRIDYKTPLFFYDLSRSNPIYNKKKRSF